MAFIFLNGEEYVCRRHVGVYIYKFLEDIKMMHRLLSWKILFINLVLNNIFLFNFYILVLYVWVLLYHIDLGAHGSQSKVCDTLEAELQMALSCHVGVGNRTQIL